MTFLLLGLFVFGLMGRLSSFIDSALGAMSIDVPGRFYTKILWILLFIVASSYILARTWFNDRKQIILMIKKERLMIGIFALIAMSALLSGVFSIYSKGQGLLGFGYYLALMALPLLLILSRQEGFYKKFIFVNFVCAVILAIVAVLQLWAFHQGGLLYSIFIEGLSKAGFMPIDFFRYPVSGSEYLRPSSLIVDPNIAAGYFATVGVMAIYTVSKNYKSLINWLALLSSILFIGLSYSRSGLLSFVVGVVALLALSVLAKGYAFLSKGSGNTSTNRSLAVLPMYLSAFWARLRYGLLGEDGSTQERFIYGKASIEAFLHNPVFGIGIGNFGAYFAQKQGLAESLANPHSLYLRVLSELGSFGAVAFVLLIIFLFYRCWKARSVMWASVLIAILVGNIFYDYFMTPWVWFYIGIIILISGSKPTLTVIKSGQ